MYEALHRIVVNQMEEDIDNINDRIIIDKMQELILAFTNDINEVNYQEISQHDRAKRYVNVFYDFQSKLSSYKDSLASF